METKGGDIRGIGHVSYFSTILLRALKTPLLLFFAAAGNVLMLGCAFLFYGVEKAGNPNVTTFFDALWWAFSTVSTVGYGDITPVTSEGQVIGIFLMVTKRAETFFRERATWEDYLRLRGHRLHEARRTCGNTQSSGQAPVADLDFGSRSKKHRRMHFVSDDITQYCVQHSAQVSSTCAELERYTRTHVDMSIMLSGPLEASLLGFLIQTIPATRVLEIGTFTGYCALAMAGFLPEDGEVVTLDVNEETTAVAKKFWAKDPNGKKIRSVLGPALQTLEQLDGKFDLIFLDAIKVEYVDYLKRAWSLLSERGVMVADNTLMSGDVLDPDTQSTGARGIQNFNAYLKSREDLLCTVLPVRDGITLIRRR